MKKLLGILALATTFVLVGCNHTAPTNTATTTTTTQDTETAMNDDMMDKKDEQKDDVMNNDMEDTSTSAGTYQAYDKAAYEKALTDNKDVVLFVHNRGCGSCNLLDGSIKGGTANIPSDMAIFNINYTDKTTLQQFNVDTYHTVIYLDKSGNETSRTWKTALSLNDVLAG